MLKLGEIVAFRDVSLECIDRLQLLRVEISSDLNFGRFIESKAKVAAKKLGLLAKVRRYFTPGQLLMLYKAQVRSCICSTNHIWAGAAKYHLATLGSVERRAKRLIDDTDLVKSNLQSLEHRRRVASLSVFYWLLFGECAQELHDIIPPSHFYYRTSRRTASIHPYVVEISTVQTKRFASSFIPRTSRDWNNLPAAFFPSDYNVDVIKSRVNSLFIN